MTSRVFQGFNVSVQAAVAREMMYMLHLTDPEFAYLLVMENILLRISNHFCTGNDSKGFTTYVFITTSCFLLQSRFSNRLFCTIHFACIQ